MTTEENGTSRFLAQGRKVRFGAHFDTVEFSILGKGHFANIQTLRTTNDEDPMREREREETNLLNKIFQ